MTDYSEFAPTKYASEGLKNEVKRLVDEGLTEAEALRVAASTMSGAGNNPGGTVESVQTCMDIGGKCVPGLTGDDSPVERTDPFAATEVKRHEDANKGIDEAAQWLKEHDPNYAKERDERLVKKFRDGR